MKLYRGSRVKTNNIKAQEMIPADYSKIKDRISNRVIWATEYKEPAWIFGIYWQRMSIKINSTKDGSGKLIHHVQVERNLNSNELKETVYLYTMDSSTFKCVSENDPEWYSFEYELPATIEAKKIENVLNELVENGTVIITVNPKLGFEHS